MKSQRLACAVTLAGVLAAGGVTGAARGIDTPTAVDGIRHALLMLPYYGVFDFLAFSYEKGVVTLDGYAYQRSLKDDAGRPVKHVAGVLPFGPARFPGTEPAGSYPIHIIVKNGHVTLMGVVDTESDRTQAGFLARGVPGSFSVENELTIDTGE